MSNDRRTTTVWLFLAALAAAAVAPAGIGAQESQPPRKIVKQVPPTYPEIARQSRLSGTVKLTVVVTSEGAVRNVRVLGGNPVLAHAAEEAVRRWKFESSGKESTEPVAVKFENPR